MNGQYIKVRARTPQEALAQVLGGREAYMVRRVRPIDGQYLYSVWVER